MRLGRVAPILAACSKEWGLEERSRHPTAWVRGGGRGTVALKWNGPRALGVDESSLATFPEEFRQGMAARAEILGDAGANHPDNWTGGVGRPHPHPGVTLFSRVRRRGGRR